MKFYFIVAIGLEQLAAKEFEEKTNFLNIPFENLIISKGGFEVEMPYPLGLELNRFLKIPQRILVRAFEFKCRDFPKLFNKIRKLDWSFWLHGQTVKWTASARRSRLIHTDKIEKACDDGIKAYYKGQEPKKNDLEKYGSSGLHFYIRIVDDHATISFNSSGTDLYKRGRTKINRAPLRETYSAAIFYAAKTEFEQKEYNLVDPMCGSGVILKEAKEFYTKSIRDFDFEKLKNYKNIMEDNLQSLPQLKINITGSDIDKESIEIAKEILSKYEPTIENLDFFERNFSEDQIIIFNPPYNERIKILKVREFFSNLSKKLEGKKAIAIIPDDYLININGKVLYRFLNGGIPVSVVSFN